MQTQFRILRLTVVKLHPPTQNRTSLRQRHLRIGYGRAAAILDAMVKEGYIGDMDGSSRARPVLQRAYDDLQDISEMSSVPE